MRICVDATSLLVRSAGVKNYVHHWMASMRRHCPEHQITAFPWLSQLGALDHERSMLTLWQTVPRLALLQAINRGPAGLIDSAVDADVFHASNLIRRLPSKCLLTATIHDMTAMLMPEVHTPSTIRADRTYAESVLRRANGLIAVSESSKQDAVRLLGLNEKRIAVVYSGVDPRFFDARPKHTSKPYVLFVGTIEPRKNIDVLLDAWLQLPNEMTQEFDLVLAGPKGWKSDRTLARIQSGISGVRYAGYVPERELPSLTAGATAFVYPSLYEGFGFPAAQAMAAGVPVITSNVSALPEVVGDAGLLIDPRDPFALRDAIQHLLLSPSERQRLGSAGRERARLFTWERCARASSAFFTGLTT